MQQFIVTKFFKIRIIVVFLAFTSFAKGQDISKVSLGEWRLKTQGVSFKIAEIIDARKDKNIIGVIQRGINNRKDLAVFEKPGIQELQNLLERSELISEKGLILRMTKYF